MGQNQLKFQFLHHCHLGIFMQKFLKFPKIPKKKKNNLKYEIIHSKAKNLRKYQLGFKNAHQHPKWS